MSSHTDNKPKESQKPERTKGDSPTPIISYQQKSETNRPTAFNLMVEMVQGHLGPPLLVFQLLQHAHTCLLPQNPGGTHRHFLQHFWQKNMQGLWYCVWEHLLPHAFGHSVHPPDPTATDNNNKCHKKQRQRSSFKLRHKIIKLSGAHHLLIYKPTLVVGSPSLHRRINMTIYDHSNC